MKEPASTSISPSTWSPWSRWSNDAGAPQTPRAPSFGRQQVPAVLNATVSYSSSHLYLPQLKISLRKECFDHVRWTCATRIGDTRQLCPSTPLTSSNSRHAAQKARYDDLQAEIVALIREFPNLRSGAREVVKRGRRAAAAAANELRPRKRRKIPAS
jgi:hypothetical protein